MVCADSSTHYFILCLVFAHLAVFHFHVLRFGQEARIPLQLWVTQKTNGLLIEEAHNDGQFYSCPIISSAKLVICFMLLLKSSPWEFNI